MFAKKDKSIYLFIGNLIGVVATMTMDVHDKLPGDKLSEV